MCLIIFECFLSNLLKNVSMWILGDLGWWFLIQGKGWFACVSLKCLKTVPGLKHFEVKLLFTWCYSYLSHEINLVWNLPENTLFSTTQIQLYNSILDWRDILTSIFSYSKLCPLKVQLLWKGLLSRLSRFFCFCQSHSNKLSKPNFNCDKIGNAFRKKMENLELCLSDSFEPKFSSCLVTFFIVWRFF